MMKFVYFGSAEFSRIVLETIYAQGYKPSLIVSQPDRPKGRGLKVVPTQVSLFAKEKGIPLIKPDTVKTVQMVNTLVTVNADFFVVADYGKILPKDVISIPKIFTVGVHPSLLPKYRGAAPINRTLIKGDKETGVTIFKVEKRMDAGAVILSKTVAIDDNDNAASLLCKLAKLGGEILIEALVKIQSGDYTLAEQDQSQVSFADKLNKKSGCIDWNNKAQDIRNLVRGVWGWPSAYTHFNDKTVKILETEVIDEGKHSQPAGVITKLDKEGIYVSCGKGTLKIKKVKPEGKKEMDANAFVCGYRIKVGDRFV